MRYLLDVNALIALGLESHALHGRMTEWILSESALTLATSPITELGFVRVLSQVTAYQLTLAEARSLLVTLKGSNRFPFIFLTDDHDIRHLPAWVDSGPQTTDGHLLALAQANDSVLATFDERIPGAFLIPEPPPRSSD